MQIVIDIDEKIYEARKSWASNPKRLMTDLDFAVATGTVLPKGHGRLIDADKLDATTVTTDDYNGNEVLDVVLRDDIDDATTIIEADKSEDKK